MKKQARRLFAAILILSLFLSQPAFAAAGDYLIQTRARAGTAMSPGGPGAPNQPQPDNETMLRESRAAQTIGGMLTAFNDSFQSSLNTASPLVKNTIFLLMNCLAAALQERTERGAFLGRAYMEMRFPQEMAQLRTDLGAIDSDPNQASSFNSYMASLASADALRDLFDYLGIRSQSASLDFNDASYSCTVGGTLLLSATYRSERAPASVQWAVSEETVLSFSGDTVIQGPEVTGTANVYRISRTAAAAGTGSCTVFLTVDGFTASVSAEVAGAGYRVVWKNYDGSILERDENLPYGTMPSYDGTTPQRSGYFFTGWTPVPAAVTGDAEYTARFSPVRDGQELAASLQDDGDSGVDIHVSLKGTLFGKIFGVLYDANGRMCEITVKPADRELTLDFQNSDGAATAAVLWVDDDFIPVCAMETISPVTDKSEVTLSIDKDNLGTYFDQGQTEPFYIIDGEFEGVIRGTLSQGSGQVKSMAYSVRDDRDIELKNGEIPVSEDWSFSDIGLSIGLNTVTVTALLQDGSSVTDHVTVESCSPDLMENIFVDENDDDGDGLINYLEDYYGTDRSNPDTDGDGLSDYYELLLFNGYDPLNPDTGSSGKTDGDKDYDGDGLTNAEEIRLGTDPTLSDSDRDGLTDYDEARLHLTNPVQADTDGDGAEDGWEIENGCDPLHYDASFLISVPADAPNSLLPVTAGVSAEVSGILPESITVTPVEDGDKLYVSSDMAGYLGQAYEFRAAGEILSATLVFRYDTALGTISDSFQPRIYYLDEETGILEEVENQTAAEGEVRATVTHFSTYILLNRVEADAVWEQEIKPPITGGESGEEAVLSIAFVIDYSKSMSWNDPDELCKQLSKEFVSKLRDDQDLASIIKFIRRAEVVCGLTTDKQAVYNAIDSIEYDDGYGSYSGTDGSTGLHSALDVLEPMDSEYKYVIFITDGEDNGFTYSYDTLIQRAVDMGVVVYTVGMGTATESVLKNIAEKTGGKYYHATTSVGADDLMDLDSVFREIEADTVDLTTDTNQDGIPDYFNDLIYNGDLVLSNGSSQFQGIDFNYDRNGNPSDDYDGDGLKNGEELRIRYDEKTQRVSVTMRSSPILPDTDGDGKNDKSDPHPLSWDVCDRDLAMFASLAYEDGTEYVEKFYPSYTVDQQYYWLDFAKLTELSKHWTILDYKNLWTQAAELDKFSATTYENGSNIVIAFRGTNDGTWEWLDNILCYGMMNYHAEEALTELYVQRIYDLYVKNRPGVKLYITGHSLGGYLAQIGTARLVMDGHDNQLEKVAYFNGIGMKYNRTLFWTKLDEIDALKKYCEYSNGLLQPKRTNGKLISYHIYGDWVSMLGTHYGDEIGFEATREARANHAGKYGSYDSFWEAIKTMGISTAGVTISSIAASPTVMFYYTYYGSLSFIEYTWITHETDSFLYYLTR